MVLPQSDPLPTHPLDKIPPSLWHHRERWKCKFHGQKQTKKMRCVEGMSARTRPAAKGKTWWPSSLQARRKLRRGGYCRGNALQQLKPVPERIVDIDSIITFQRLVREDGNAGLLKV